MNDIGMMGMPGMITQPMLMAPPGPMGYPQGPQSYGMQPPMMNSMGMGGGQPPFGYSQSPF
jgi:hypothetical protein